MSVTVVVCTRVPLVAEIVSVDVPTGVVRLVVTVRAMDPLPPETEVGVKVAVAPVGKPAVTEKLTAPVNPLIGVTVVV
jgi:hypothetical protein